MSLLLNIDTAADKASICISDNENILGLSFNEKKNDQASWLHPAIDELLKKNDITPGQLQGISVSIGPGSYTGLRIGLSAAKGFCYALNIPLITVSTLKLLAFAVQGEAKDLICPVIDARRMEIFTALYNKQLEELTPAHALIVKEDSFNSQMISHNVLFCGNACTKLLQIIKNDNAFYTHTVADASHLAMLAHSLYFQKQFSNTSYTEPLYVKDFFSGI